MERVHCHPQWPKDTKNYLHPPSNGASLHNGLLRDTQNTTAPPYADLSMRSLNRSCLRIHQPARKGHSAWLPCFLGRETSVQTGPVMCPKTTFLESSPGLSWLRCHFLWGASLQAPPSTLPSDGTWWHLCADSHNLILLSLKARVAFIHPHFVWGPLSQVWHYWLAIWEKIYIYLYIYIYICMYVCISPWPCKIKTWVVPKKKVL